MYLDKQSDCVSVSSGSETPLDGVICVMWGVLVYTGHHRRSLLWNNILCQKIYGELGGTGIELDSSTYTVQKLLESRHGLFVVKKCCPTEVHRVGDRL